MLLTSLGGRLSRACLVTDLEATDGLQNTCSNHFRAGLIVSGSSTANSSPP
jgi:hypothetical protein